MWCWEKCLPQVEPLPVSVTGHGGCDSSDDAKWTGRVERGGWTGSLQGPVLLDCLFLWSKSLEDCFCGPVILMASRGSPALISVNLMGIGSWSGAEGEGIIPPSWGDLTLQPWAVTPICSTHACSGLLCLLYASGRNYLDTAHGLP